MECKEKRVNLVMSGGGVKGIAYAGVFEAAEKRGYRWANIAGVSAGAIAGAIAAAGYTSGEVWNAMQELNFDKIKLEKTPEKLYVVQKYLEFSKRNRISGEESIEKFLNQVDDLNNARSVKYNLDFPGYRCNMLENIITYSKRGCLFDGDYMEEWIYRVLARRGIRTFGDLRGGIVDEMNPCGYKVRMTGVDCNRAKLVILPDDVAFYGMEPDKFEVAKAVRISTAVPFAFKPVELKANGSSNKTYNLVDGGVFDRYPYWLIGKKPYTTIGFKLNGGKKKFFSLDTGLDIIKSLISAVQDIGISKKVYCNIKFSGNIDTGKISFLDFSLSEEEKMYLYNSGRKTALSLFNNMERGFGIFRPSPLAVLFNLLRKRN